MRNKLLVGVVGLVMAGTMVITASATALAETCKCGSNNTTETDRYLANGPYYDGPDYHAYDYYVVSLCHDCWEEFVTIDTEYEYHSYELDEETGIMECDQCGDTFQYDR